MNWKYVDHLEFDKLAAGEMTWPIQSGRLEGVSVGRDDKGFFVCTHRARSESYDSVDKIPIKDIKFIESTGQRLSPRLCLPPCLSCVCNS